MKSISKALTLFCVLGSVVLSEDIKRDKKLDNAKVILAKLEQVSEQIAELAKSKEFNTTLTVAKSISNTLGYVVPMVSAVSDVISLYQNWGTDNQFDRIAKRFDRLEAELIRSQDHITKTIGQEISIDGFKDASIRIANTNRAVQRHAQMNTNSSRSALIKQCEHEPLGHFFVYMDRELTWSDSKDKLSKAMLNGYDLNRVNLWVTRLLKACSEAMYLQTVCIGTQFGASHDVKEHIQFDMALNKKVVNNIKKFTEEIMDRMSREFWGQALMEINKWNVAGHSNKDWVNNIYSKLSKKYSWRKWLVLAWERPHSLATTGAYSWSTRSYSKFLKFNERVALISSSKSNAVLTPPGLYLDKHHEKDTFCSSVIDGRTHAQNIRDHLVTQFSARYEAIAVVIEDEDLAYRQVSGPIRRISLMVRCSFWIGSKRTRYDVFVVTK